MGAMRRRRSGTRLRPFVSLLVLCLAASAASPGLGFGESEAVTYHGGPLLATTTSFAIFWLPDGRSYGVASGTSERYEGLALRYLNDVGSSPFYGLLTQYSVPPAEPITNRSTLGASWVDSSPYPRSATDSGPLTDTDFQAEIARAIQINGWPAGRTSVFYLFLAAGAQACRSAGSAAGCTFTRESPQCGWHSVFWLSDQPVVYAVLPEAWSLAGCLPSGPPQHAPNGDPAADAEISVLSHEQFELVTDPAGDGWHDDTNREIADLCQQDYGSAPETASNVQLSGHPYWLQAEWSNRQRACALGDAGPVQGTTPPSPLPTAATAFPAPTALSGSPSATATGAPMASPTATLTAIPGTRVHRDGCKKGYRLVHGKCKARPKGGGG